MHSLDKYKVYSTLLLVLFLPSFFYVSLNSSSMALGVGFFVVYALILMGSTPVNIVGLCILFLWIMVFILYYLLTSFAGLQYLSMKVLLSFYLIILLCISAYIFSVQIQKLKNSELVSILKKMSVVIVFLGVMPLFWRVEIFGYDQFVKSVFPFSEPSHFAITVVHILFATGLFLSTKIRVCITTITLVMAILFPSLVLLIIALSMLFIYLLPNKMIMITITLVLLLLLYYFFNITDNASYFLERSIFNGASKNLTVLVYLQGWEDMFIAFYTTYGLGVGFQNMGGLPPGVYGNIIYDILGEYKNRADSGFLAAKIIGEFGVFGVLLISLYLHKLFHSVIYIYKCIERGDNKYIASEVFGHSIIIMFFFELFARGYGYFSPGVFLFFVAIFLTSNSYSPAKKDC